MKKLISLLANIMAMKNIQSKVKQKFSLRCYTNYLRLHAHIGYYINYEVIFARQVKLRITLKKNKVQVTGH